MNRIFRVIWSKAKNCYVVASEFAKVHTKAPANCSRKAVVAGVLVCVLSFGAVMPAFARSSIQYVASSGTATEDGFISFVSRTGYNLYVNGQEVASATGDDDWAGYYIKKGDTWRFGSSESSSHAASPDELWYGHGFFNAMDYTEYLAGNGVAISSDNKISVKGGTGITVNSNGVSITSGSIASGNVNAVTGGTVYSELRPANGTYVRQANSTAANLKALDTQLKTTTDNLATETTNRTNADTALSNRIGTITSDGNYIKKSSTNNVSANLSVLDTQLKNANNRLTQEVSDRVSAVNAEQTAREASDAALSDRIGTINSNGNYIRSNNDLSQNVSALDAKIGSASSSEGIFTKSINTVNENIRVLDNQIGALNDGLDGLSADMEAELAKKANKDASNVTDPQSWADKLGTGTVSSFDTKLVTGSTVAGETRINADGNYVLKNNTASQNISALDVQVKANADAINDLMNNTGDALDDKANVDLDNITPEGEQVIRDLAKGSVKVINGNGTTVTKGISGNATTYGVNVVKDGVVERNNTGVVTGGTVYNAIQRAITDLGEGTDADLENKANVDASNVSGYANAWGQAIGTGAVADNNKKLVTGDTVFDEVRPDNGNYVSKNDTTGENLNALDTQVKANADAIDDLQDNVTDMLDGKANVDASNVASYASKWGEALGTGSVLNNDTELVTGGTMYDELRPNNGNYVSKANTTAENLGALDTQVKSNTDAIADLQDNISDISDTKANKDLDNITNNGKEVIRELAKGSVKVVNGRNTTVTEGTEGNAKTYAVNVVMGTVDDGNTGLVSGGDVKDAIDELSGSIDDKLLNYAKKDASNVTDSEAWGDAIGTGIVADGNEELVTGGTVYTAINNTVNHINDALDAKANVSLDNITPDGEGVIRELAKGSVKVINGNHTTVTEGTSSDAKTYAVNVVTDGVIAENNEDVVSGGTVYTALENQATDMQSALNDKANVDASNVTDAEAWGEKIATGEIINNDVRAVSGKTVYTAIENVKNEFNDTLGTTLEGYAKRDASNVDAQVWGENLGSGTIDGSEDRLVSGKTVASETRIDADGNYIQQSNTAAQNLTELDRVLKETRDIAENSALTGTDENAVHYNSNDKSVITLEGAEGTVITNLKDGEISADSKDAVTGKQLFETNEKVNNNTENIQALTDTLGTVTDGNYVSNDKTFGENIGALDTQLKTVSDGLDTVRNDVTNLRDTVTEGLDSKADVNLNNITEEGRTVISDIAKDSVKVTGSGIANVTSSTEENTTIYNVDVQANGVVEEGNMNAVSGGTVYNSIQEVYNDMYVGLDNKANTDLSNLTNDGKEIIREVMKGDLDNKADKVDLDTKANIDASNIDIQAWERELGTGVVEEGNTGLINGDTVFRAVQEIKENEVVKADFDDNVIRFANEAKYDGIDTINVSKSDGSSRVMTGIATDPKDPTSAANVAYVNAVGDTIVRGVNDGFRHLDDKVGKAGASAAAMASLPTPPMDGDEKWAFSAAVGHYDGKTSGAVGAFYRPQDNVIVNVRGAVGNGEDMIGAGVGVALERGNTPHVSKAQLVRTINAQAGKISEQETKLNEQNVVIEEQNQRIARLEATVSKLVASQEHN